MIAACIAAAAAIPSSYLCNIPPPPPPPPVVFALPDTLMVTAGLNIRPAPEAFAPEPEIEPLDRTIERPDLTAAIPEPEPTFTPVASGDIPEPWYSLAICESGMYGEPRWDYNGGSGFDGGIQFAVSTWSAYAPSNYPEYAWQATPQQQIEVGKLVLAAQGVNAWPTCGPRVGLTMADAQ